MAHGLIVGNEAYMDLQGPIYDQPCQETIWSEITSQNRIWICFTKLPTRPLHESTQKLCRLKQQ